MTFVCTYLVLWLNVELDLLASECPDPGERSWLANGCCKKGNQNVTNLISMMGEFVV